MLSLSPKKSHPLLSLSADPPKNLILSSVYLPIPQKISSSPQSTCRSPKKFHLLLSLSADPPKNLILSSVYLPIPKNLSSFPSFQFFPLASITSFPSSSFPPLRLINAAPFLTIIRTAFLMYYKSHTPREKPPHAFHAHRH